MRLILLILLTQVACDQIYSPSTVINVNQGQSTDSSLPSPPPSCVLSNILLTPTSGTTDHLVAVNTLVTFSVILLDPNGANVPPVCITSEPVFDVSGDCKKLSGGFSPSLQITGDPGETCVATSSKDGKTASYTMEIHA